MITLDQTIILENDRVLLEPLSVKHFDDLYAIAQHEELWEFTSVKIASKDDFRKYFDEALVEMENKSSYAFAIFDKQANSYGGCTRLGNIALPHKRLEIGWTWYHPQLQRTGLNRNCKFLLLSYGFEKLLLNRIELKTSLLNIRSQTAIKKIGATQEGILRKHMVNDDQVIRDSVIFSIINEEWPQIKSSIFKQNL